MHFDLFKTKIFFVIFFKLSQRSSISYKNCRCCTDGAPFMIDTKSGFHVQGKYLSSNIKYTHCMIFRLVLVSKTFYLFFATI